MTDLILTYEDALNAIERGLWDWHQLTCRLSGNELPALLAQLEVSSPFFQDADQLALALTDAWVKCNSPEEALRREKWLEWFRMVGYIVNSEQAEPPEQVTLYRGGVFAERMAWTGTQFVAEWHRDRWPNGRLWTASVQADRLLAHFDKARLHHSGRSEDEYVIDPSGLAYMELR